MLNDTVRWFHLLAAAIWIGGSITVAALIPVLRGSGATKEQIRAVARRFGLVAWIALATSVTTGIVQLVRFHIVVRGNTRLMVKLVLVAAAITVAYVHQVTAARTRPAVRGALEGLSLLLGLAILAVAVTL